MRQRLSTTPVCSGRTGRTFFLVLGSLALAVGMVGVFVPVLPTTPFLLLAALCYARGSSRCYRWLTTNRVFGRYLDGYLSGRGVSWRVKAAALLLLWVGIGLSVGFAAEDLWLRLLLVAVALGVSVHVLTIKGRNRGEET